jgi:hypothetical protein
MQRLQGLRRTSHIQTHQGQATVDAHVAIAAGGQRSIQWSHLGTYTRRHACEVRSIRCDGDFRLRMAAGINGKRPGADSSAIGQRLGRKEQVLSGDAAGALMSSRDHGAAAPAER